MNKSETNLISITDGNLWLNIFKFSLPLMLSNILQVLFNMSDIAVVGHFAGSVALGSVGSTALIVALFTGFLIGIGSGVNSIVARYYGAQKTSDVSESVHNSFIVSLVVGLVLMVVGIVSSHDLLKLLNTKDELFTGAVLYLRIYFLGMPAMAVYNFGNGVLSAVGDTKKPLLFLFIGGVANVILNLIFVIAFKWSVAGVAIASIISQYISAVLIIVTLFKSSNSYALSFQKLRINMKKVRIILSLGLPAGLQNAIFGIANLFIQAAVNSFDAVMVEGNSAAANADALIYDVMAAFYVGCTSFIAQNYGAGNKNRVLKSYLIGLFYSFAGGTVLGGLLLIFGRQFLSVFTSDAVVIEAGLKRIGIMGFSYAVSALMDCSIAASRGLGKTFLPTVIVILGSCVFRVIWVYTVFAYFHTIPSLYLLYFFSWSITGIAEAVCFMHSYRKIFA